ncbi:hypothetical protein QBC41DRAFT_325081 [Cercophora samala]|uniref:ER-bound oxygenase mpaB/mpaB'/Rubber oxygenase catalytic domain-containing protein n=1 Tax=Cercophora samala TaxID=330535 RepID=A0AA40DAM3_9PEZI|nr:hypothetical protein QBC41DRAFT_325081 [Cercophora samala]
MTASSTSELKDQTKKVHYLGSQAYQRSINCSQPPDNPVDNTTVPEKKPSPPSYHQHPTPRLPMSKTISKPTPKSPPPPPVTEKAPLHPTTTTTPTPEDHLKHACGNLITWLGGPYAILLQIASPGIALGSCSHSRFQTHPISRFRRTAAFIMAVVHGTEEQKALICGAIKKQRLVLFHPPHPNVMLTRSEKDSHIHGPNYTATDPLLQKWTAATLFVAGQKTHEMFSIERKPMPRAEKEVLCQQFGRFATALDMPGEMWPRSLGEFERYFDEQLQTLEITEASEKVADILLRGMELPWFLMWALPVMRVLMAVWLPERCRVAFGLPDPNGWLVWRAYWVIVWLIWGVNWLTPERMRVLVESWMKRDMARAAEDIRVYRRWMI